MRPLLAVGLLAALFLLLSSQWLAPAANNLARAIAGEQKQEGESKRPAIGHLPLRDGSLLLYARYDGALHDCYWMRASDQLYHCGRLECHADPVVAYQVDHLVRRGGLWEKAESIERTLLPIMRIDPKQLHEVLASPGTLSITELAGRWWDQLSTPLLQRGPAASWLYVRLLLPCLCLLAVIAPAPWCLRQRRRIAQLQPLAVSLSLLLCLWTLVDAALILSTQQLLAPEWTLGIVALVLGGMLTLLWKRLCNHSS
jgi:lipopolysaccharide export system permease protein